MTRYNSELHPAAVREAYEVGKPTVADLARMFKVAESTIHNWMRTKPEFLAAVMESRQIVIESVVSAMYRRAVGIEYTETKVVKSQTTVMGLEDGEIKELPAVELKTETTKKFIPPETDAGKFLLTNLDPANWKNKREDTLLGEGGGPIVTRILIDGIELDGDDTTRDQ